MTSLADMIWIELQKAWRSRVPLFTGIGSLAMPLGIGFLIFVARNPGVSQKLGLVNAKANLIAYATTDWQTYLGLMGQMLAAGGFLLFCLIVSWVFGREFVDGTVKDLLAVPVPRASILLGKFIVAAAWSAAAAALIFVTGLVLGVLIGLPQGSPALLLQGTMAAAVTTCLLILVVMPIAFFASAGRGYLLPIGMGILALIMANVVVLVGWGEYFPFALPGLYAQGENYLGPLSYAIAVLTAAAGILGTYVWWRYADQR